MITHQNGPFANVFHNFECLNMLNNKNSIGKCTPKMSYGHVLSDAIEVFFLRYKSSLVKGKEYL